MPGKRARIAANHIAGLRFLWLADIARVYTRGKHVELLTCKNTWSRLTAAGFWIGKGMLSVHQSSKNRIIHFLLAAGSFVEYLLICTQRLICLTPLPSEFGALIQERVEKQKCLPENLEQVLHTLSNRWRNPLQDMTDIFSQDFFTHGFHFKYCFRADFHDAKDTCVCKFWGDLCEFYHFFSCHPYSLFAGGCTFWRTQGQCAAGAFPPAKNGQSVWFLSQLNCKTEYFWSVKLGKMGNS